MQHEGIEACQVFALANASDPWTLREMGAHPRYNKPQGVQERRKWRILYRQDARHTLAHLLHQVGAMYRFALTLVLVASCTTTLDGAFTDHDEVSDFDEGSDERSDGLGASFNRHRVMTDEFFSATYAIDGDGLQQFLETSPYNNRSWLADATINGERASDAIVSASAEQGINPLVMMGRMQVEKSLVSKTAKPSKHKVDFAFGCGCHDNQSCSENFRGLDKQITCAAETLSTWYQSSRANEGEWRKGLRGRSLDPLTVTPENHATASLYSYTPWVLKGRGGNWLVWNITRNFEQHAKKIGVLRSAPALALAPSWSRDEDGSYDLSAQAAQAVSRVVYYADDVVIGEASQANGNDFAASYTFRNEGPERLLEARGYTASGTWIAMGNASLDVTSREAVYIRQTNSGEYQIGIERPGADIESIEALVDGLSLTDHGSAYDLEVQANFDTLGAQAIEIRLFDSAGQDIRGYQRELEIR